MVIQGSQAVPVATPIVFWRPTRFSRSQETAESHRLLTIIFILDFLLLISPLFMILSKLSLMMLKWNPTGHL